MKKDLEKSYKIALAKIWQKEFIAPIISPMALLIVAFIVWHFKGVYFLAFFSRFLIIAILYGIVTRIGKYYVYDYLMHEDGFRLLSTDLIGRKKVETIEIEKVKTIDLKAHKYGIKGLKIEEIKGKSIKYKLLKLAEPDRFEKEIKASFEHRIKISTKS